VAQKKKRKEGKATQWRCGAKTEPLHYDASDVTSRYSLLTKRPLMQWKTTEKGARSAGKSDGSYYQNLTGELHPEAGRLAITQRRI
jgi:hypothetical protein